MPPSVEVPLAGKDSASEASQVLRVSSRISQAADPIMVKVRVVLSWLMQQLLVATAGKMRHCHLAKNLSCDKKELLEGNCAVPYSAEQMRRILALNKNALSLGQVRNVRGMTRGNILRVILRQSSLLSGEAQCLWFPGSQGIVYWLPPPEALDAARQDLTDPACSCYGNDDGMVELRAALEEKV